MLEHIKDFYSTHTRLVREREIAHIFYTICMTPDISRKKLSQMLKIRPTSVSNHVQELISSGLVVVENKNVANSKRGRPELVLKPNYNRFLAITIYAENRTLMGALINFYEETLVEQNIVIPPDATNEEFLSCCQSMISEMRQRVPNKEYLVGIGISLFGTVNPQKKQLDSVARWPNVKNLQFGDILENAGEELLLSGILETELNFYLEKNPSMKTKRVLLFHWGFGVGASFSESGNISGYKTGHFGEIGHARFSMRNTKKCHCGKLGCLETEVALWALLPKLAGFLPEATENERKFAGFMANEESACIPPIWEAIDQVSLAIGILNNVLFPDRIVLIGPFSENEIIRNELIKRSTKTFLSYPSELPDFDVITGGFLGSRYASAYPLFYKAVADLLVSCSAQNSSRQQE